MYNMFTKPITNISVSKNGSKLEIKGKLQIELIQNDDGFITKCPALDLISYGDTKEEAFESIGEAIELFFECITEDPKKFSNVLKELGWAIEEKGYKTHIIPPFKIKVKDLDVQKDLNLQQYLENVEINA